MSKYYSYTIRIASIIILIAFIFTQAGMGMAMPTSYAENLRKTQEGAKAIGGIGRALAGADERGAGMNGHEPLAPAGLGFMAGGAQVDAPAAGLKALVLSYKDTIDEKIIEIAKENPNIDKKVELIGGLPATFEGFRNELKKRRAEIEEIKPDMILVHMPNGEFGLARAMAELINTLTGIKASGLLDDDKENWKTAIDALAESV